MAIIGVLLVAGLGYYQEVIIRARRIVLEAELRNLRMILQIYRVRYHRYPDDIRLLEKVGVAKFYQQGGPLREDYLKFISVDEKGYPLDPFGQHYFYNPESGEVYSLTSGYESW